MSECTMLQSQIQVRIPGYILAKRSAWHFGTSPSPPSLPHAVNSVSYRHDSNLDHLLVS